MRNVRPSPLPRSAPQGLILMQDVALRGRWDDTVAKSGRQPRGGRSSYVDYQTLMLRRRLTGCQTCSIKLVPAKLRLTLMASHKVRFVRGKLSFMRTPPASEENR
jgi:hypothetical protein